jgi:ferredoxin-type protein NapH
MSGIIDSLAVLFGREPRRAPPDEYTTEAMAIHTGKRQIVKRITRAHLMEERKRVNTSKGRHRWRNRRWATILAVNLMFVLSFYLDIQILEGALTSSRFLGFHLTDVTSGLEVMLAYKILTINLIIGMGTLLFVWWLLGGRTFCSWVCPYHLLAEWAEPLHLWLVQKKLVKDHRIHRGVRTAFFLLFMLLAVTTGYLVFGTLNPVGILNRALIYGPGLALIWVALLLAFEIFYSRRFWCRYVCPIGLTYGVIGSVSPIKVIHNITGCAHEGDCRKVCMVPHVLDCIKRSRAPTVETELGADCTRCGMCVEICPTKSPRFEVRGLSKLI